MPNYSEALKINKLSKNDESDIINQVAQKYKLDDNETKLLHGIRHVENGKQGREFGVLNSHAERYASDPDPSKSFKLQAEWAAGTIKNHYDGDLEKFAERYAPTKGATNDVHGLNSNWLKNMKSYLGEEDGDGN